MKRAIFKLTFALALSAAAFTSTAQAAPDCKKNKDVVCPAIFDPVVCDHNKTYSNSCFAAADCATGCVPAGTEV